MTNQNWNKLNDQEFEKALEISLSPKTPDEEIVKSVTPWRKAMTMALLGLAFSTLTPAIFFLNYILPAIGIVLSLLGFRKLRRESKEFFACYILSIIKAVSCVFNLFMCSTIYASGDYGTTIGNINLGISLTCSFATFIFLTLAIKKTQLKANLPVKIKGPVTMIILYAVLFIWAVLELEIPLLMYGVIALYIAVFVNLFRILKDIDTAGYAIESAPVRIPDSIVAVLLVLITAASMVCGYLFFHSYKMDWKEQSPNQHSEVSEIKENLLSLGFPERVLNDMSADDIEKCQNTSKVFSQTEEWSVNESFDDLGFEINPDDPDTKDIRLTHVLLKIDEERNEWRFIHHFEWINGDDFYGTEAIQIWGEHGSNWVDPNSYIGRVLYTENGKNYASDFFAYAGEHYKDETPILGGAKNDVFAKFSFPEGNLRQRGYVSYVGDSQGDTFTGSWINYNHQKTWIQFPVTSAAKSRQKDATVANGAYIMIMDIFSFFTDTEEFHE